MDKPAPASHSGTLPWVRLRSASSGPTLFKRMIDEVDPAARPGDIVAVYDKTDAPYGVALYNPKSLITLRLLSRGIPAFGAEEFFADKLEAAVEFRRGLLRLDERTDAYRVIHDHGDGLPGLVVDRYGKDIVLEFYSLGMFKQAGLIERILGGLFPGARFTHRASSHTQTMEGFRLKEARSRKTRIQENGVAFEVDLTGGHKTGFFCDQRENRLFAAGLAAGRKVLDVCSFTGGFGLYAKKLGKAEEVTCVELDPEASEICRRNADLNDVKVRNVCVDAFPYLRQMGANQQTCGMVILDPYKLIATREGYALGRQKYLDLNKLALAVVEEGGILVTCSCSGLLPWHEFEGLLRTAAGVARRRVQVFRKSGAGPDHPVAADYPEGEYLKVLWCRVV
ncbi:MAG: class I SAM-dependent rRNA methyltransferase [Elusimicrobiota bacterium]